MGFFWYSRKLTKIITNTLLITYMTLEQLQLPIFATFFTGLVQFILQVIQMIFDQKKSSQSTRILELETKLEDVIKEMTKIKLDNSNLHDQVNVLLEENAIYLGLLKSQENSEELIKKLIKK